MDDTVTEIRVPSQPTLIMHIFKPQVRWPQEQRRQVRLPREQQRQVQQSQVRRRQARRRPVQLQERACP